MLLESEGGGAELSVPNKSSPLADPVAVGTVYKAVVDFLLRSPPAAGEGDEGEGGGEPRWSGARRASIGVGVAVRDGGCRAGAIPCLGHRVTLLGIVTIQVTVRGEPGSGDGGINTSLVRIRNASGIVGAPISLLLNAAADTLLVAHSLSLRTSL